MKNLKFIPLLLILLISCSKESEDIVSSIAPGQSGDWHEIMTNGDYFQTLNIDESGRLSGSYYIADNNRFYNFTGKFTEGKFTIHLDIISSTYDFAVVKFDSSELVLASYFKGYFFTRNSSENPYLTRQ